MKIINEASELVSITNLKTHPENPRRGDVSLVAESIRTNGFYGAVVAQRSTGYVLAGNHRLMAADSVGLDEIPVVWVDVDDEQAMRILLADNRTSDLATYDDESLGRLLEHLASTNTGLEGTGYSDFDLDEILGGASDDPYALSEENKNALFAKFIVPPMSILDSRQGYWRERKEAWISTGIISSEGREGLASTVATGQINRGNNDDAGSVFDPVLAELAYRWFCPQGGIIADPFAGGSVRGIVAAGVGRTYVGTDVRLEQVEANLKQWQRIGDIYSEDESDCRWVHADGATIANHLPNDGVDMIFTCPPYHDLEVYSDQPDDISSMEYGEFLEVYRSIISGACASLKDNRFAAIVVGEIRDKAGSYRNFVGDTVQAFVDAGLKYHTESIYITSFGSLPIRVGRPFKASRKLGKTHQNLLVFVKGDAKKAASAAGPVEVVDPADAFGETME